MHPRDPRVVDGLSWFAEDALDGEDAFGEPDMGELGCVDDVTERPYPLGSGMHEFIDDEPAFVYGHPGTVGQWGVS